MMRQPDARRHLSIRAGVAAGPLDADLYFDIIGNVKRLAASLPDPSATDSARAVAALAALAQETRLAIFRLLLEYAPNGLTPGAIAMKLGLAPATLSFHLKELAGAGLVDDRRESRFIWYRANVAAAQRLVDYLTETCCRVTCGERCGPACAPGARPSSTSRKRISR